MDGETEGDNESDNGDSQSMLALKEFTAGGVSGIGALVVGYPFDTVKTIMQNSKDQPHSIIRQIRKTQSNRAIFRGLSGPLTSYFLVNAITFGSFKPMLIWLDPEGKDLMAIFIAGCFAGTVQLIPTIPVELIKVKMQITAVNTSSRNATLIGCIRETLKEEGLRGLYRGGAITAARDIPSLGIYFSCYYFLRELFYETSGSVLTSAFLAGGIAGTVSWVQCLPLDVIKTCIQTGKNRDFMDCVRAFRPLGYGVYFTGVGIVSARAAIVNAVTFLVYDVMITTLNGEIRT